MAPETWQCDAALEERQKRQNPSDRACPRCVNQRKTNFGIVAFSVKTRHGDGSERDTSRGQASHTV